MRSNRQMRFTPMIAAILCAALGSAAAMAQSTPAGAAKLFRSGQYEQVIQAAEKAIAARQLDEAWWLLKIRAEMASGEYAEALKSFEGAAGRYDQSIALRLVAYDVYRMNNMPRE